MPRNAGFLGGWFVVAAVLAGACSVKPVGKCGERLSEGVYRFCGTGQEFQCVCETGRCAVTDPSACPESGMRYTDDDSCVAIEHLHSAAVVPSTSSSASCQAPPADADADADGDEGGGADADVEPDVTPDGDAEPDVTPDGDVESDTDGGPDSVDGHEDGEEEDGGAEDGGLPPVVLNPPLALGSAGDGPVLVDFGASPLLEFVAWDGSANLTATAQLLEWDGDAIEGPQTLLPVGATTVRGAHSWTTCRSGSTTVALFAHRFHDGVTSQPLLLWVEPAAVGGIVLHDITELVFGTDPSVVHWFAVAGRADGPCWVAWVHDRDDLRTGVMTEIKTVQVASHDVVGTAANAFNLDNGGGVYLHVMPLRPDDPAPEPRLMTTVDDAGNLLVVAPAYATNGAAPDEVLLMGQQLLRDGTPAFAGDVEWARLGDPPCDGGCAGIESPEGNALAATGTELALTFVLVDAAPSTSRRLMRQVVNLRDMTTEPVQELTTMGAPARMPNVVVAGGAFVGAASRWDGGSRYDTGSLYLFDPAAVAVPMPDECCSGAYSALQVGRDDAVVATWFDLDASEQVVRLLKLDDLRMPAVGWPVDGFRLFDPSSFGFGGDLPRGVAAPDGGAVVVFSEGGAGGHRLQFVRVAPGS